LQGGLAFANAPAADPVGFNSASASTAKIGLSSVTIASVTPVVVTRKYNASLVGLDVPINLKYQFNPQKTDTYIAAGLSSGTFINETYKAIETAGTRTQESTTHNSFNNFDLAKTLNVSFGMGYPLGKTNRLIIEPFLKYPLDGLGSEQLKFGAGGVNLKLNFQSTKK
jgi:hypothetical protein